MEDNNIVCKQDHEVFVRSSINDDDCKVKFAFCSFNSNILNFQKEPRIHKFTLAEELLRDPSDVGIYRQLKKKVAHFCEYNASDAKQAYLTLIESGFEKELFQTMYTKIFSDPIVESDRKKTSISLNQKGKKKDLKSLSKAFIKESQRKAIEVVSMLNKRATEKITSISQTNSPKVTNSKTLAKKNELLVEALSQIDENPETCTLKPRNKLDKAEIFIFELLSRRRNSKVIKNAKNAKNGRIVKKAQSREMEALARSKEILLQRQDEIKSRIKQRSEKLHSTMENLYKQRKLKVPIQHFLKIFSLFQILHILFRLMRFRRLSN